MSLYPETVLVGEAFSQPHRVPVTDPEDQEHYHTRILLTALKDRPDENGREILNSAVVVDRAGFEPATFRWFDRWPVCKPDVLRPEVVSIPG